MSLDNFINDPYGYDKGDSGQKPVIARASIWPAWKLVSYGETFYFTYKYSKEGELEAKEMAYAESVENKLAFMSVGILTTIYADHAIQYMFDENYSSFVQSYHSKEKFKPSRKDRDSEYLENLEKLIFDGGPFPYDTVYDAIVANQEVFENTHYCKLVQVVDEVSKAKGITNSKGYPYQFFVVEKVYDSREAALADNKIDEAVSISRGEMDNAFDNSSLSELALKNRYTMKYLQKESAAILGKVKSEYNKITDKDENIFPPKALKLAAEKIAGDYGIEPADIDLLEADELEESEIPF